MVTSRTEGWENSGLPHRRLLPAAALAALVAVAAVAIGTLSTGGEDTLAIEGDAPVPVSGPDQPPAAAPAGAGHWQPIDSGRLGARQGTVSAWTGDALLVWGGRVSGRHVWFEDGAAYRPRTDRWTPLAPSPLAPRAQAAAGWTGDELIVWGGVGKGRTPDGRLRAVPLDDGAAYTPAGDTWRSIAASPLSARREADAIWTGDALLVWGGREHDGGYLMLDGASYDPQRDRWSRVPPGPIDDAQVVDVQLTMVGDEILVWATTISGHVSAAYHPQRQAWRTLPTAPQRVGVPPQLVTVDGSALLWGEGRDGQPMTLRLAPGDRRWVALPAPPRTPGPSAVFVAAGTDAVSWQGAQGLLFDTVVNAWAAMPEAPPLGPGPPAGAWTGDRLLVWHSGGRPGDDHRGALWTPGNPWRRLDPPEPVAAGATALWTGWGEDNQQLLIWGGLAAPAGGVFGGAVSRPVLNETPPNVSQPVRLGGTPPPEAGARLEGFAYDAVLGLWENLPPSPLSARYGHAAVWTGEQMVVLGGRPGDGSGGASQREAAAYEPVSRQWHVLPALPMPVAAGGAVWTGRQITAAGLRGAAITVASYEVAADRWTELPAPPLRRGAVQVVTVWSDFEVWTIGVYPDGRVAGAAWSPRRRSWRELPATDGLVAPVASTWTGARVFLVDAAGRTRSYGRGGTFWRRSPRLPVRSDRLGLTWNGYALLAIDPATGDMATLGARATSWTAFPDPGLSGSPAAQLLSTGRDVFAVTAGGVAVLSRQEVGPAP